MTPPGGLLSGSISAPRQTPWSATLSSREREIACCVASGCTNRDIARKLEITDKTVEKHLTRIFRKLEVRSRSQLAIFIVSDAAR